MNASPSETRQPKQARAIRTRERILEQAETAFAARGFEAASLTSDILEPAGISVGSFYHQFSDKRAVLHALIEERRRAWQERIDEIVLSDQWSTVDGALRAGIEALLDDVDRQPSAWWIHFRELHNADPEIRSLFEEEWAVWLGTVSRLVDRWTDTECDPGTISFVAAGLAGLLRTYLAADAPGRAEIRVGGVEQAVNVCAAALAATC